MFVSADRPTTPPRVLIALDDGDPAWRRGHAAVLAPVSLADALRICLIARENEPERYDRAAVRWLGRFALEVPDATLEDMSVLAEILTLLPAHPVDAIDELSALAQRHHLADW
jgi:hypothetical protein